MKLIRSLLGLIIILLSVGAIVLSAWAYTQIDPVLNGTVSTLGDLTSLAIQSVETAEDSLLLAKDTVVDVTDTLGTVEKSALDMAQTLTDTQPFLSEIQVIVSETVPDSIDALNEASPDLIEVAGVVDDALTTLSGFTFDQRIPVINYDISFDLGIVDYSPNQPLDESVEAVTTSFQDVPEQLRGIADDLETTSSNLSIISGDVVQISADLTDLNAQVAEVPDQLDDFIAILDQVETDLGAVETQFTRQLDTVKLGATVFLLWFALLQLAPLVVGWYLLRGLWEHDGAEG